MKAIEIEVQSSFIKSAMYNEEKQSLRIGIGDFWYYYYGVTRQKMCRFRKAASKGKYFCSFIKGQYKVVKRKVKNN